MNTDQNTANQEGKTLHGIFSALWRICLLAGVFASGIWFGRQWPAIPIPGVRSKEMRTMPNAIGADPVHGDNTSIAPDVLLHSLQSQIRALRTEHNRVNSEMNENRIHYMLLRNHGYDEHSPECIELVRRQNSLAGRLDELSAAMPTWLAMESQLIESIRRHGPTTEIPSIDRELRKNIERHLARCQPHADDPAPIPDELWMGAGDSHMGLPDNTKPIRPFTGETTFMPDRYPVQMRQK